MDKLKVLLIAFNNLGNGGIQNQLMGIVRTLKDKVDFDIVIWDDKKEYYRSELMQYNVNIIECFRDVGGNILRQKADAFVRYNALKRIIISVIKSGGPYDAVHCNNGYDAAACLEAAFECCVPVRISHAHNMENPSLSKKFVYPAYKVLYEHHRKKIRKYATHMIGCSQQVADYFFGSGMGQVLHIGIDTSKFNKESDACENITELLHVGRMGEQKNQLFLIDVMDELLKIRKDVHLTMIGDGDTYLHEVRRRIEQKSLGEYVDIKGADADVPDAMAKADLFIFPSAFEGFGITLIEAQAAGVCCVASDAVSEETNCGGVEFLPLGKGAKYWAEFISKKIENGNLKCTFDVSEFSVLNMADRVFALYCGK